MSALAAAAPAAGGDAVTLITGALLAVSAVASSVITPVILARRRARREAITTAASLSDKSGELTLQGWTALNAALQEEIKRLQGVVERMQARADVLETEIESLRKLVLALQKGTPGAAP